MAADMDPGVCLMSRKPWGDKRDVQLQESRTENQAGETWQRSATE